MYKNVTYNSESLFLYVVAALEILSFIKYLKNKTSFGFDEISDTLLKFCSNDFAEILTFLINKSFQTGVFLDLLKLAIIKHCIKKDITRI
jgi:hypothetical protein